MVPRPRRRSAPLGSNSAAIAPSAHERFLRSDRYRVEREWKRYEGTAQRDLYRVLREHFVERNLPSTATWAVDLGSGPGRFTRWLSARGGRAIAFDLSSTALRYLAEVWPVGPGAPLLPERVRGDAVAAPFRPGSMGTVLALGNTLGFASEASTALLRSAEALVAPAGRLLLEIAPGPGESSRYLTRLPPGSMARLLRVPTRAVLPRIEREGFRTLPPRKAVPGSFRRISVPALLAEFPDRDWTVLETMAVAPALGPEAERLSMVQEDPKAWEGLLAIEQELGRRPDRWREAASVLLAVERKLSDNTIN